MSGKESKFVVVVESAKIYFKTITGVVGVGVSRGRKILVRVIDKDVARSIPSFYNGFETDVRIIEDEKSHE